MNAIDKVIAAVHEWDIDDVETFVFELLDDFVVEVLCFGREDYMRDLGFLLMVRIE